MKLKHLQRSELIGYKAKVLAATNQDLLNIGGKIVDETRNSFVLENTEHEKKRILKNGTILKILTPKGEFRINCTQMMKRPYERIKK
jgi:ribonuclease P protein subunit POP4